MAIFKCKSCGAPLDIRENQSVVTCEYCGLQQTLPRLDDDRRANLYDRANHFRRNNDYDKAMSIYEQILNEDKGDAEAYWSLVLCRYGIEYVEDPASHRRMPTVNRAQDTSIFADEDYKSALENADGVQLQVYAAEAKQIDEIQKGILAISQKEQPFDVFICYKETDANGRRTQDSVLATDLYHQLTQEGFKVFFSRITLEDKLGTAYEPYIFAALNSAKVMVVLGTKSEYFNAVWVKNEWSRYLKLIRSGAKKVLIPAYRDMDPYDLPEEFSHLQAQDMSKLGFMQDLIRGIKKLTASEQPAPAKETVVVQSAGAGSNVIALIKRGNMALEDGEWEKAADFFDQVLNQDAENAEAYLGQFLAEQKKANLSAFLRHRIDSTRSCKSERLQAMGPDSAHVTGSARKYAVPSYLSAADIQKEYSFDLGYDSELSARKRGCASEKQFFSNNRLWNRAKSFGSEKLKAQLSDGENGIYAEMQKRVDAAQSADAQSVARIRKAYAAHLAAADQKVQKLYEAAEARRKNEIYDRAVAKAKGDNVPGYEEAIRLLQSIPGWKDAEGLADRYRNRIAEIKAEEERQRLERERQAEQERLAAEAAARKRKRTTITIVIIVLVIAAAVAAYIFVLKPMIAYSNAEKLLASGEYDEASAAFEELGDYKDASTQALAAQYAEGEALLAAGDYDGATQAFTDAGDYSDAAMQALAAQYAEGEELLAAGDYDGATQAFTDAGDYSDASTQISECRYQKANVLNAEGKYDEAYQVYAAISGYKDVDTIIETDDNIAAAALEAKWQVGNTVTFGSYGGEDIEWLVLEANGDQRVLISVQGLDAVQFNKNSSDGNEWESSYIRTWLNDTFYNAAFTDEEKANLTTGVTGDNVYLLSIDEAERYFADDDARVCYATDYAVENGAWTNDAGACWWWLRSPGSDSNSAAFVNRIGLILSGGCNVNYDYVCVRPVVVVARLF